MPISTTSEPTRHAHDRAATPGPICDAASRPTTPPAPHRSTPPPTTPARPAPPTPPAAAPSSAGTPNAAGSTALPDAGIVSDAEAERCADHPSDQVREVHEHQCRVGVGARAVAAARVPCQRVLG